MNIQHTLLVVLALGFGAPLLAQEDLDFAVNKTVVPEKVYFNTSSFQVEDKCILEVNGAIPNSVVEFYSTPQGGELLKRDVLNQNGKLQASFDAEKSPSFVLNARKSINGSAKGTGFVQFLNQKDFIVRHIDMLKEANTLSLSFESLTNPDKDVSYELRSLDKNGEEHILHVFEANDDKTWETFEMECDLNPRTQYRFVIKSGDNDRYSKEVYNTEGQNDFVVYPTIVNTQLVVEFKQVTEKSTFSITDVKGVVLFQGETSGLKTEIEVSDLAEGVYFIRLDKYPDDGVRFIKQ